MTGRLAIDFGTSNTVLAVWDPSRQDSSILTLPEISKVFQQGEEQVSVIPSIIHYAAGNRRWMGNQVLQKNLYQSERTFRWMKRYISNRSPLKVRIDDQEIGPSQAGKDFLSSVLLFASQEVFLQEEEIALSVPVEAYEHYENWLSTVAEEAGFPRFRLIDEPSAAALGYSAHIQPGNTYLVFDFGGGTMHASVVLMEEAENQDSGRRCRVLGKSGRDIGGSTIDQWIFSEVLDRNHRRDSDSEIRAISNALLVECERAKEKLSFSERADLSIINPDTGSILGAEITRSQLEELFDRKELFTQVNQTVRSALQSARDHGYDEDAIRSVLLVGGSSQIPSIQRTLRQIFGKERVLAGRPWDAVARGAAAFISGLDFYDHIQHDYAIRFVHPQKGHDFRTLVQRGTPYPTPSPVARLTIKAAYDGQKQMRLEIFEMGQQKLGPSQAVELVFDPSGAARVMPVTPDQQEQRSHFWMNEHQPTFLSADPPAKGGEPRFEVEFSIDENKRLVLTARDLLTGVLTHKNYPVIKLS